MKNISNKLYIVMKKERTTTKQTQRAIYFPPCIEVIEMAVEGCVMAGSATGGATTPGYGNGGDMFNPTPAARSNSYSAGTASEIEDMINDILTIEQ